MAGNIKGITIEIGGDTTKLERALKDVNKTSRELNKELKDIDKSMKFNPKNTELVAQKQRVLAESVENTKKKLETLKSAQEQAQKALAEGKIGQAEYDALTREILKTENQLKSLQGELDKSNSKWKVVGEGLKSVGDKMVSVGQGMSKAVTAPIARIGVASIAAFKEVDAGLDTIVTKTGATGDALKGLEDSYRNIASSMPASFNEVGNAIGEINTQFGLTGIELEQASEKMIKFAQINDTDITSSTINAKQAIEKYGLSTKDLDMVLDSVSKTAQNTGVSTDKLFDLAVKGSPQIKEMGLNFAQATEMLGRMEQKGIDGQKALSYLTKAQTQWAKDGKSMVEGLSELQDKLSKATTHEEKLAIAAEAFGTKGGAYMLEALENGALNADDFANAMQDAAGTVGNTWEGIQDPIDKVDQAMNNLKLAGSDVGKSIQEAMLPALEGATEKLKSFSEWFKNLSPGAKQFIVTIGFLVAAIGPALLILGQMVGAIGSLVAFFGAGGAGAGVFAGAISALGAVFSPIGLAIMALIAIGALLITHWEEVKTVAASVWTGIKEFFSGVWDGVSEAFSSAWQGIKSGLEGIWNGLKTTAKSAFDAVKSTIETVWNGLKSTASTIWQGIKSVVEGVWNGLKSTATSIWEGIKSAIESIWNGLKTTASSIWQGIKTAIESIWNGLKSTSQSVFNGIKSLIDGVWNNIKSTTSSAWETIKNAMTQPIEKGKEVISSAMDKIRSVIQRPIQFPKIKLPHFKITGKFSFNPPQVPHLGIEWYDKGGIFSHPSIIGVGEKRPEFVGALDDLKKIVADVILEHGGGGQRNIVIQKMEVRDDMDIKKIAQELYRLEQKNSRGMGVITP